MSTEDAIIELLEDLCPGVDFKSCTTLIDDRRIDSLTMIALVADLEDKFEVDIPAVEIVADNFNSAAAIAGMIDRLVEEDLG